MGQDRSTFKVSKGRNDNKSTPWGGGRGQKPLPCSPYAVTRVNPTDLHWGALCSSCSKPYWSILGVLLGRGQGKPLWIYTWGALCSA